MHPQQATGSQPSTARRGSRHQNIADLMSSRWLYQSVMTDNESPAIISSNHKATEIIKNSMASDSHGPAMSMGDMASSLLPQSSRANDMWSLSLQRRLCRPRMKNTVLLRIHHMAMMASARQAQDSPGPQVWLETIRLASSKHQLKQNCLSREHCMIVCRS